MGSQHPPLAALYLLELLGEYPFWGVCRGYLGLGYKREDASIRSLGLTQACMSPLWSIAESWGHQDHCLFTLTARCSLTFKMLKCERHVHVKIMRLSL